MSIIHVNGATFIIWSLTSHSSRHINIEKGTTHCTADLQKPKFTKFYQIHQLCSEPYNSECGKGLRDVKRDGAGIERF